MGGLTQHRLFTILTGAKNLNHAKTSQCVLLLIVLLAASLHDCPKLLT